MRNLTSRLLIVHVLLSLITLVAFADTPPVAIVSYRPPGVDPCDIWGDSQFLVNNGAKPMRVKLAEARQRRSDVTWNYTKVQNIYLSPGERIFLGCHEGSSDVGIVSDLSFAWQILDSAEVASAFPPEKPSLVTPTGTTTTWDNRFTWHHVPHVKTYIIEVSMPKLEFCKLPNNSARVGVVGGFRDYQVEADSACYNEDVEPVVCSVSRDRLSNRWDKLMPSGNVTGGNCDLGSPYQFQWRIRAIFIDGRSSVSDVRLFTLK